MSGLADLFGTAGVLIGMVHLLPLPGSPRWSGSMEEVVAHALDDARALAAGGIDGLLVENYGDVPFHRGRVDAATVAAMARVVTEVRRVVPLPVGVNVLKNDPQSALAVAAATGVRFIRVNVHTGAVVADQGIIQPDAAGTLRYRRLLGADVKIFADVQAKHGVPLTPVDLEQEAKDSVARGLAESRAKAQRSSPAWSWRLSPWSRSEAATSRSRGRRASSGGAVSGGAHSRMAAGRAGETGSACTWREHRLPSPVFL